MIAIYDPNGLHFYLNDWTGSRRVQTDYEGVVEQTCTNQPYGNGQTCSATPSEELYAGLERDSAAGLDNAVYRSYASAFGRWLTPDPYDGSYDASNPQSLNRYAYVGNNPLTMTDPSGLDSVYGCQTIYVSGTSLSVLGGTDVAACAISVVESVSAFARISDELRPIEKALSPIAEALPGLGELAGAADLFYEFGKSFGWWGGSSFHGNAAASQSGKNVLSIGSVNAPGPPGTSQSLPGANSKFDPTDPSYQLAVALGKNGAYTINDPRFVAGFYAASFTVASGAFVATDLAAGADGSLLFGRGYYGWTGFLNGNAPWGSAIRVGFGWNGAQQVFRIAGNLISGNGHIDIWPPSAW